MMTYVFGTFHIIILLAVGLYIAIAVLSWEARRSAPNDPELEEGKMMMILVPVFGIFIVTNAH